MKLDVFAPGDVPDEGDGYGRDYLPEVAKTAVGRLVKDKTSGSTQAHGDHGHFASGGDGGEPKVVDGARWMETAVPPSLRHDLDRSIDRVNRTIYPSNVDADAERAADIERVTNAHSVTRWMLADGTDIRFAYDDWDKPMQTKFINEVAALREKYPDGSKDIAVVGKKGFDGGIDGLGPRLYTGVYEFNRPEVQGVTNAHGEVLVRSTVTYQSTTRDWVSNVESGFHPQEMLDVEPWRAVLTHEFGHSLDAGLVSEDRQRSSEADKALLDNPSASTYGRSDPHEAYAEAFAQWELSSGKTTDPLAQALAKTEGWKA